MRSSMLQQERQEVYDVEVLASRFGTPPKGFEWGVDLEAEAAAVETAAAAGLPCPAASVGAARKQPGSRAGRCEASGPAPGSEPLVRCLPFRDTPTDTLSQLKMPLPQWDS